MKTKQKSQNELILTHFKNGKSLTPMKALRLFNCWALSSRISNLKKEGYIIQKIIIEKNGKRFAKYFI